MERTNTCSTTLLSGRQGRLAVIAGRLDSQFVVDGMGDYLRREQLEEFLEGHSAVSGSLAYEVPKDSGLLESEVAHEDHQKPRDVAVIVGLGIKKIGSHGERSPSGFCKRNLHGHR